MVQIAIIQVAPTQAPTVNTSSSSSSGDFAPHLSKAIDNQNHTKDSSAKTTKSSSTETDSTETTETADANDASPYVQASDDQSSSSDNQNSSAAQTDEAIAAAILSAATEGQQSSQVVTEKNSVAADNFFSSLAAKLIALETDDSAVDEDELVQLLKTATETNTKGQLMSAVSSASTNNENKNTILAQLQQIIDNSSETGTVSIKSAETGMTSKFVQQSTTAVQAAMTTQPQVTVTTSGGESLNSAVSVSTEGLQNITDGSTEQLSPQRQSTQQQYYDAKLALESENGETSDDMQQQSSDSSDSGQLQNGQQVGQSTFSSTQNTGAFSVAAQTALQTNTGATTSAAPSTMTLPSGNTVSESEVMHQITERFQVTQRTAESHINIKLHPAELGELKIDLTVKDGSIRAHVIAQSQQVQQLIEKNMNKLKETLTEQGFSVEEITVASQSDAVGEFDLFDGELAQQNEYVPQQSQSTKVTASLFQSDEMEPLLTDNVSGVNLTI